MPMSERFSWVCDLVGDMPAEEREAVAVSLFAPGPLEGIEALPWQSRSKRAFEMLSGAPGGDDRLRQIREQCANGRKRRKRTERARYNRELNRKSVAAFGKKYSELTMLELTLLLSADNRNGCLSEINDPRLSLEAENIRARIDGLEIEG